jgi:hypothetical protein
MAQDNQQLRTQLLQIADTLGCMPESASIKSFFSNPNNIQGILDAQTKYGLPSPNKQSYHTGLGIFGSWHDFCERDSLGKFYAFANLSMTYPTYSSTDQTNCQKIKDALVSLNSDKNNISQTNKDIAASQKIAYDDKISDYTNLYANLTCDTYLANQAQIKAATTSVDNALNTVTGGNVYIKYALIGAVAYFGFIYIKRLVKGESK